MALTVKIHQPGGPDALCVEDAPVPQPGVNEVLVRQRAIGVNFIDIYHRTGLYKLLGYPVGLGMEAAGVVEAVGAHVEGFREGDRVAYCGGPVGAYAQYRTIPARFLVKLPEGITDEVAAAGLLKGLTAHFLLNQTFQVRAGDAILFHAAAGGVGLIACQMAQALGAKVIGTVGNAEKADLAKANGCQHPLLYTDENWPQKVRELTAGQGVDVAYDSVGKNTYLGSLDALKRFGMLVCFGQSSGPIPPLDPQLLSQKGSLYLTRPTLLHHIEDPATYQRMATAFFDLVLQKKVTIRIGGLYHLGEVKQAHIDLESRKTTGALVLTV